MQQYNVHKQDVSKMKYVFNYVFQEVNYVCPHTNKFLEYIVWTDRGEDYDYVEDPVLINILNSTDYVLNEINY